MPPPEKKPPTNRADRDTAADVPNTLAPAIVRLPLGAANGRTYPAGSNLSVFRLRNPTRHGGDLSLQCVPSSGAMKLRRELKGSDLATSTTGTLRYRIPAGTGHVGNYYLVVEQPAVTAFARLVQVGCSRESPSESSKPFVPWNFWFWPTARKDVNDPPSTLPKEEAKVWEDYAASPDADKNYWTFRARRVLTAFAQFEGNSDPGAAGTWELDHHQAKATQGWEGHCPFAAVASIIFEPPTAKTKGGFHYLANDLEFLGAEFAGVFCHDVDLPLLFRLDPDPFLGNLGLLDLLRPEGPHDATELTATIDGLFAGVGVKQATLKSVALLNATTRYATSFNGSPQEVRREFGRRAADFFSSIQTELRENWSPVLADFRGGPDGKPDEVWNHALFQYEAEFIESAPANDDTRYDVHCSLYCNQDVEPPMSDTLPARIANGLLVPEPKYHLRFDHIYQFSFDAQGELRPHQDPAWLQCRSGSGRPIYAPRFMKRIIRPASTLTPTQKDARGSNGDFGNAYVTWGVVSSGLLQLRSRYK